MAMLGSMGQLEQSNRGDADSLTDDKCSLICSSIDDSSRFIGYQSKDEAFVERLIAPLERRDT